MDQYLLLAKGARGRAVVDLIHRAVSDPAVFAFGELLDVQSVRELEDTEHAASLALLKLFSTGTWADYRQHGASLPNLTVAQQTKLKQLTVVSLAQGTKEVPYQRLMVGVEVGTVRELEDLIITHCFYPALVSGKLDQRQGCLQVEEVVSRDVMPDQLPAVTQGLATWLQQSSSVLQQLEQRIQGIEAATKQTADRRAADKAATEEAKASLSKETDFRSQETMLLDEEQPAEEERGSGGLGSMFSSRSKRRR
mmetsp:Transcript_8280/g.24785  ORF Transcript_8280/g.24785 Transcript_8280/m.24785 type:complete len:252 (-) Transcript_8280:4273-5028(-)